MNSRKRPSELSDRQIRRKIAKQKALFHEKVQERLSELEKEQQNNLHETKDNKNCMLTKPGTSEEKKSCDKQKRINFDSITKLLCTYDLDEVDEKVLEEFESKLSSEQLQNPQEAINDILNVQDTSDMGFDFLNIIKKLQHDDDDEEESLDFEDLAIYDALMALDKKDPKLIFVNSIRKLCIKYISKIPHVFINELLVKLKEETGYPFPKDARTFLKTPRSSVVHRMGDGEYCHYGIESALTTFLISYRKKGIDVDCIKLIANMDGALLADSSEDGSFIISVSETVLKLVEVVGIYQGEKKPKDSDDLVRMFVRELTYFINNGVTFEEKKYNVKLDCLVCDAPAKAYILKVKLYSGYYSCSKCTIKGDYLNKVYFPTRMQTDTKLRTNEEFRNQEYEYKKVEQDEYQLGETIMKEIPNFGPITDVVLDYMHLICLGVMIKLIELWIENPKSVLSEYERKKISDRLSTFKEFMPSDFSRNPRNFKNVRRLWKAHELRAFLLYTGPIALYKILPDRLYLNFLYLHVAISILVNPILCESEEYLNYAEKLLNLFVESFETIYGESKMVFNIHNVSHLVIDVRRFGPLDNFSAFRFENHIMKIKQLLRKGNQRLQQIGNRLMEIKASKEYDDDEDDTTETDFTLQPKLKPFEVLKKNSYKIDCRNEKDKYVLLDDGTYLDCHYFMKGRDERIRVVGYPFKFHQHFYEYPLSSSILNINIITPTRTEKTFLYESIKAKVCKFPLKNEFVAVPIIHTYNLN